MLKPFLLKMYLIAMAICGTVILATSCGDDEETVPVSGVSLADTEMLLILGQKQPMIAQITPANATNKSVKWESSVVAVATVNEAGQIEAKSVGTTVITVTTQDGGIQATCEVKVQKPIVSVAGISLNKTVLPLLVGQRESLIATITPEEATIKTVLWESSAPTVASVNESGEVEALSVGTAIITATTLDGGKVATCEVTVDASNFTVSFESNGGSKVNDVIVNKGETLTVPVAPTKVGGPVEGLYSGEVNPDLGSYTFGGWYTDQALTNSYNFSTPVTNNLTLYAKWTGDVPTPINVDAATGGNIVEKTFNYLRVLTLAQATTYTLVLGSDVTVNASLSNFANANVTLRFMGKGQERIIQRTTVGNIFVIEAGTFILGNHIKITGTGLGNYCPFTLQGNAGGKLIMEDGAKISDITGITGRAGAVYVNSGDSKFIMNGGEICNNELVGGSGVHTGVAVSLNWGSFEMNGGLISGNKLTTTFNSHCMAGGVLAIIRTPFIKNGGVIKDNTAVITTAGGVGKAGQQVFCYSTVNPPANHKKVDANLGENDDIGNDDLTNPLWQSVP